MGYSVSVKPTDNFDKFREEVQPLDMTEYISKYLIYKVMSFEKKDLTDIDVMNIVFDLDKQLSRLSNYYFDKEKARLTAMFDDQNPEEYREKGELTFCGWDLADNKRANFDINSVLKYVLDQLFILITLTKNYDYYDESERWSEKLDQVEELLDYLEEECTKYIDIQVIEEYHKENVEKKENEVV